MIGNQELKLTLITVSTSTEKRLRMRPEGVPLKKYMVALMRPYIDDEAEWKVGLNLV